MTTILYIILGFSVGVGCTLIFLQERFLRERRLFLVTGKAEREKAAKQLSDLDEKWESECEQYKQELAALQAEVENSNFDHSEETLIDLKAQISTLESENDQLRENTAAIQAQLSETQNETDFLRGEVDRLEEEKKNIPPDDFIVLAPPGGHLLPGSVARSLMGKKR